MSAEEQLFNFDGLVGSIHHFHDELVTQASRAVNISLTLRNWLIGCYIEEYERFGIDRADYGDRLMDRLAEILTAQGISRCDRGSCTDIGGSISPIHRLWRHCLHN